MVLTRTPVLATEPCVALTPGTTVVPAATLRSLHISGAHTAAGLVRPAERRRRRPQQHAGGGWWVDRRSAGGPQRGGGERGALAAAAHPPSHAPSPSARRTLRCCSRWHSPRGDASLHSRSRWCLTTCTHACCCTSPPGSSPLRMRCALTASPHPSGYWRCAGVASLQFGQCSTEL